MTKQEARENVDKAIYKYVEALGHDATGIDYSSFNELLDNLGEAA